MRSVPNKYFTNIHILALILRTIHRIKTISLQISTECLKLNESLKVHAGITSDPNIEKLDHAPNNRYIHNSSCVNINKYMNEQYTSLFWFVILRTMHQSIFMWTYKQCTSLFWFVNLRTMHQSIFICELTRTMHQSIFICELKNDAPIFLHVQINNAPVYFPPHTNEYPSLFTL